MSESTIVIRDERPNIVISASGPQGATGAGIKVIGELATTADLPALPDPSLNAGDAYIIDSDLWVYATSGQFVNTGFLEGAAGPQGPAGATGPQGSQGLQG